jgi:RNA recognition motif-containing protein
MSKRLFVGGLSWGTDDAALRQAFEAHGEVTDAKVITDRETGRSRGFGFVTFGTAEAAKAAMDAMQGAEIDGRTIRIDEARERQGFGGGDRGDRGPRGDRGDRGGFGGGFGGDRDEDRGDRDDRGGFGGGRGGPRRDRGDRPSRGRGGWGDRD